MTSNRLSFLPKQMYQCKDLTKLHVARNKLTSLPEVGKAWLLKKCTCSQGIRALAKLQVVDVAGNELSMFPVEFHLLPLKELYCEGNRFVRCEPIQPVQNVEVLSLKELVARFVLWEDRNSSSLVHKMLSHYPYLSALLASGSCCALCSSPFLTTWLECVHFVSLRKLQPTEKSSMMHRARLPPSNPTLPTTDGRLSHNAVRSQMPTDEVTNTLQVPVPLRPQFVHPFVFVCEAGDKEHLSCRERRV
ncbi:hypothetical protein Q8A73_000591 [Channa argus]|nr:hypothetical protein Q8A73_000591 [Channa argus]